MALLKQIRFRGLLFASAVSGAAQLASSPKAFQPLNAGVVDSRQDPQVSLDALTQSLRSQNSNGRPTASAHLAAQKLISLRSLAVVPFLVQNIDHQSDLRFTCGTDSFLESHPYVLTLVDSFSEVAVEAIVNTLGRSKRDFELQKIEVCAHVLLGQYGFVGNGRMDAISVARALRPNCTNANITRLVERLSVVEKAVGR